MIRNRIALILAAATIAGAGCNRYYGSTAGGEVVSTAEAQKTVVLHVENLSQLPMELRTFQNGQSAFIGSVGGRDTANILLDRGLFPTADLYIGVVSGDIRGATRVGPLSASRGDLIRLTVQPTVSLSNAIVFRQSAK